MTYKQIAASYGERFGQRNAKKTGTIKVIVNNIKSLEVATGRNYLQPSLSKPETYRIHPEFVEYQRTAVILLEAERGYKRLNPDRPVESEISREDFERYVSETYELEPSLVAERVKEACDSRYLSIHGEFIRVEERLNHDEEYLKLVLNDYVLEKRDENPKSDIVVHLTKLLSLYVADHLSKAQGEDK